MSLYNFLLFSAMDNTSTFVSSPKHCPVIHLLKLVRQTMRCSPLFLFPSNRPNLCFLIRCPRNFNCMFLMLTINVRSAFLFFKSSPLLKCSLHSILRHLLVEPHFRCVKSLFSSGMGLSSIHCHTEVILSNCSILFSHFTITKYFAYSTSE